MPITIRKSGDRGHADHGWLDTFHTFSFADYQDPRHLGFRSLRVINEDRVAPGEGFPRHGHRDMEILTYVLEGELEHQDSMGTRSVLRHGDVQRMSAGTGVHHSEYNHSKENPLHLLQIWIEPALAGIRPGYEERQFAPMERPGLPILLASPESRDGSLKIHQDALVWALALAPAQSAVIPLAPGRHAWVQLARGSASVNGMLLQAGDGAAISSETTIQFACPTDQGSAEILIFDLA